MLWQLNWTHIAGTRVPLRTVLASLAEGGAATDNVAEFPTLTEDAFRPALASLVATKDRSRFSAPHSLYVLLSCTALGPGRPRATGTFASSDTAPESASKKPESA